MIQVLHNRVKIYKAIKNVLLILLFYYQHSSISNSDESHITYAGCKLSSAKYSERLGISLEGTITPCF